MLLPSSQEMKRFDELVIESGMSSTALIERAGEAVWNVLREGLSHDSKVLVLCGPGNNGADGKVLARLAKGAGYNVEEVSVKGEGQKGTLSMVADLVAMSDTVVDALLGTGQKDAPRGEIARVIELVCEEQRTRGIKVVSIDVPTGLDASSGRVFEPCIEADLTIAIQCPKRGLTQFPARERCGEILTVDIGIPTVFRTEFAEFDSADLDFPQRQAGAHKSAYGRVLVVGGSKNMPGASVLVSHAAQRIGAGKITKISMDSWRDDSLRPEIMRAYLQGSEGALCQSDLGTLSPYIESTDVVVIGPGVGTGLQTKEFCLGAIDFALKRSKRLVLDADALNILSPLNRKLAGAIITPHPGEASRLLGCTIDEVEEDRFLAVKTLCSKTAATVVLKGASTIVGYGGFEGGPGFSGLVHSAPNPFIASGGCGDALSGAIAGLCAVFSDFDAANWGNYLHSRAGRMAYEETGGPVSATDLIEKLPFALGEILTSRR